jgi:hypothetical protein
VRIITATPLRRSFIMKNKNKVGQKIMGRKLIASLLALILLGLSGTAFAGSNKIETCNVTNGDCEPDVVPVCPCGSPEAYGFPYVLTSCEASVGGTNSIIKYTQVVSIDEYVWIAGDLDGLTGCKLEDSYKGIFITAPVTVEELAICNASAAAVCEEF